jgi:hypothetical protein
MSDILEFICPHCEGVIQVLRSEVNCCIFRHGQFKDSGQQIPPHSSKIDCDIWAEQNRIWGCGKPFRIHELDNKWIAEICDYI